MIKKIKTTKKNKCIPLNFQIDLGNMTIITGENNAGKTTFIKQIVDKKEITFFGENKKEIEKKILN